jgi:hypothetical protein
VRFLTSFRVFVTLIGLAAGLILSPASKPQSEIAPDHFDGTDSWEAVAHHKLVVSKSPRKGAASQTDRHTSGSRATLQLTGRRQTGARWGHGTSTIQDRSKMVAQNSKKAAPMQ